MASNRTLPAVLHIRDFIEDVAPDPTRPDKRLAMQLKSPLNIPIQLSMQSDDVEVQEIPTMICFFCETGHSHLYEPEVFVYAWGPFLTTITKDEGFHIILNAHTVSRYAILILL
jgi:hypothetical protein